MSALTIRTACLLVLLLVGVTSGAHAVPMADPVDDLIPATIRPPTTLRPPATNLTLFMLYGLLQDRPADGGGIIPGGWEDDVRAFHASHPEYFDEFSTATLATLYAVTAADLGTPPSGLVLDPLDPTSTATPEPATLLLWGTSVGGLALARWYRRRLG